MARHLKFYQEADLLSKKGGYRALNVFVRVFLMRQDLDNMKNYRQNNTGPLDDTFEDLITSQNALEEDDDDAVAVAKDTQQRKINHFFKIASEEYEKMFERWVSGDLSFLAAFSEYETARLVCQRMLGLPFCADKRKQFYDATHKVWRVAANSGPNVAEESNLFLFDSTVHGRTINLQRFAPFVEKNVPKIDGDGPPHFQKNREMMVEVAFGRLDLWNREDPNTRAHRIRVLIDYAPLTSSNQGAERANKDQNLSASNGRKERNTSKRMAATACLKEISR
jgi:hypothetical protein